jgi:hypothetical protein
MLELRNAVDRVGEPNKRCEACCRDASSTREPDTCRVQCVSLDYVPRCPIVYLNPLHEVHRHGERRPARRLVADKVRQPCLLL